MQPVTVILDTGSADFIVIAESAKDKPICQAEVEQQGCATFGFYSQKDSSSYQSIPGFTKNIQLPYGSSASYGIPGTETVHVGGVAMPNFTFFDIDEPGQPVGIIGLSFETGEVLVQANHTSLTIVDQLFELGHINRRAFSLYLDDQNANTGSVLFGGVDSSKYTGDLVSVPVDPIGISRASGKPVYASWRIPCTSISFTSPDGSSSQQLSAPDFATPAVLDSGTSTLFLPNDIAQMVYQGIGAVEFTVEGNTAFAADCTYLNSNASLTFQFGGSTGPIIALPMSELLSSIPLFAFGNGVPACLVQVQGASEIVTEESTGLLFGDPFMRNAYIVYDMDNLEISLAQAKFNQSGTSHVHAIPSGSGLPGVSSTATGTASQLPLPTGSIASGTGGFISQGSASSTGIPASAPAGTFSLGASAPTSGSGVAQGQATQTAAGGSSASVAPTASASASASGNVAPALQPVGSMKMTGAFGAALAVGVFVGMLAL